MSNALTIQLDKPVKDEQGCRDLMTVFHKQIINTLPKHIPEGVLMNAVLNSIRKNELAFKKGKTKARLIDCSASSMLSAIMCCAETGLVPDSPAQECHLIPFGGQVTFMPGYRGLIKLARQSGDVADVETAVVYANDKFSYYHGLSQDLRLEEADGDRGEMVKVYAIITYTDARIRPRFEVMSRAQIDKIRSAAPGKGSDAWVNHYDEQARTKVAKRLLKTAPFSPQLFSAIDRDNEIDTEGTQELHETVKQLVGDISELRKPATDKLTADLKKKAIATGSMPEEEVKLEPWPVDEEPTPESVLHDEAVGEIVGLVRKHSHLLTKTLINKCSEENLSQMVIEALGVVKAEIAEQVKKGERLKVRDRA